MRNGPGAALSPIRGIDNGDGTYQTETGWGEGPRIVEKGSWATFTPFTLSCDCSGRQTGKPANRFCCGEGDAQGLLACDAVQCNSQGSVCIDTVAEASCCGDRHTSARTPP